MKSFSIFYDAIKKNQIERKRIPKVSKHRVFLRPKPIFKTFNRLGGITVLPQRVAVKLLELFFLQLRSRDWGFKPGVSYFSAKGIGRF